MSQLYKSLLRRCFGALRLVLLTGGLATFPVAASSATGAPHLLQEATSFYRSLRQQIWQMYELAEFIPGDLRGRTIADDLRTYGLTLEEARSLDEQLATAASEAGEHGGILVDATAATLSAQLIAEGTRLHEISNYWMGSGVAVRSRETWESFLKVNGLPEAQDLDPAIPALEKRLLAELEAGNFKTAGRESAPELAALYGKARTALTRRLAGGLAGSTPVRDFRDRTTPCTAPSQAPQVGPAYPQTARRQFQDGSVVLRMRMSPEGCVLGAAVLMSSGFTALDDAAVDWALERPADPELAVAPERESTKDLTVSFKIEE